MKLKIWWQKRLETLAKEEFDFYWKTYVRGYKQAPEVQRKILERQAFPRANRDQLAQKEFFIREYSIHEHEFRNNYLRGRETDNFACRYSLGLEEKARLAAHKRWCEMVRIFRRNQEGKTR